MKPEEDSSPEHQDWLITYGDLMSLLLCLFVMLYAVSTLQESKFQSATESLRGGFGLFGNAPSAYTMGAVTKSIGQKVGGTILFEEGSDDLSAAAKRELNEVYRQLLSVPNNVQIVGQARSGESSAYRRDLDLAYARSISVWDYLVSLGMNREKCEIVQQAGEDRGTCVEIRSVRSP